MPTTRTRLLPRLLPAALVTGITALLLGTLLGAAHAGSPEAPPDVEVPAARIGDRATYQVTLEGDWVYQDKEEGKPFELLSLVWDEPGEVRDAEGALRTADRVRMAGIGYMPFTIEIDESGERQGPAWHPANLTGWFQPGTQDLVAIEASEGTSESFGLEVLGQPVPLLRSHYGYNATALSFGGTTLCLAAERLETPRLAVGDRVRVDDCALPFLLHHRSGGTFDVTARETVVGLDAVRLEGPGGTLWFAPGIPFPVRVDAEQETFTSYQGEGGQGRIRLELVGFEPGSAPRKGDAKVLDEPAPLEPAPSRPWGMEDAGTRHPFPASLAFAKARELSPEFDALLDRSPDAYLAGSWYLGSLRNDAEQRQTDQWWMELTDGKDAVAVIVAQHTPRPGQAFGLPQLLPPGVGATYEVTSVDAREGSLLPAPDRLPANLPTAESLVERWATYVGGKDTAGAGWGHQVFCASEDCQEADVLLVAGLLDLSFGMVGVRADPADPVQLGHVDVRWSFLMTDDDGHAHAFIDSGLTGSTSAVGAAQAQPARATAQAVAPAQVNLGILPVPQAAGAGLLAILAGLTYWLWPLLKSGGALGLFSRLRTSALLEHPQRVRIHDLVAAEPGIHFQELARRTGLPNGTLVHHVQKLVDGGLLSAHRAGRYTCYFPRAAGAPDVAAAGAVKSDGARLVLAAIQARPGATMQEVAAHCGLQASTVTYHVHRLSGAGLVAVQRDGRYQRLSAAS